MNKLELAKIKIKWKITWLKPFAKSDKNFFLKQMYSLLQEYEANIHLFWKETRTVEETVAGLTWQFTYHIKHPQFHLSRQNNKLIVAIGGRHGLPQDIVQFQIKTIGASWSHTEIEVWRAEILKALKIEAFTAWLKLNEPNEIVGVGEQWECPLRNYLNEKLPHLDCYVARRCIFTPLLYRGDLYYLGDSPFLNPVPQWVTKFVDAIDDQYPSDNVLALQALQIANWINYA